MEIIEFQKINPEGEDFLKLPIPLRALLVDYLGDWNKAHLLVQNDNSSDAAWVHAYLHRKEEDYANANYWYSRAGKEFYSENLEKEWVMITKHLLNNH
jgi:hypothetical protein